MMSTRHVSKSLTASGAGPSARVGAGGFATNDALCVSLGPPHRQRTGVHSAVFAMAMDFKIFGPVIKRVAIDVVNVFFGKQRSTELRCHDNAVLKFPSLARLHHAVGASHSVVDSRRAEGPANSYGVQHYSFFLPDVLSAFVSARIAAPRIVIRLSVGAFAARHRRAAERAWLRAEKASHKEESYA